MRRRFTAGQWVFLCFPAAGVLHWHPFTISSAGSDSELSVHMRCGGPWTDGVEQLADKPSPAKVRPAHNCCADQSRKSVRTSDHQATHSA